MALVIRSFKHNNSRKRFLNSEINVTPFVDVMLVLLIIFMVTSPMLVTGVQVDLPPTKSGALASQTDPIVVSIRKDGDIYIMDTKVSLQELNAKLKAIVKEKKDARVFVRGDKNINYGKAMEVFGMIYSSGFVNVALVTQSVTESNHN
jgi:biopolymer transport protein TolR